MTSQTIRYMAFAFAAADLLIELDAEGRVSFAIGAANIFFDEDEKTLEGRRWRDLVAEEDAPLVEALVEALDVGGRYGPVMVRLRGRRPEINRRVLFNACRLPQQPDRIACALSQLTAGAFSSVKAPVASGPNGLLNKDSLGDRTAEIVAASKALDLRLALTFLELPGLTRLKGRLDDNSARSLMQRIGAALRAGSLDGQTAGQFADEQFGYLHEADKPTQAVAHAIQKLTKEADRDGQGIVPISRTMEMSAGELSPEGIVRAVKYSIDRMAEGGTEAAVDGGLAATFDALVNATMERIDAFGRMVKHDDFKIVYQPIVTLRDKSLHHFEVLSRFEAETSPYEAIRFAEETGLVEDFDIAVLMKVCGMLEARETDPRLTVAVNISGRSLGSDLFAGLVQRELTQHPKLAKRLALEITESAEIKDLTRLDAIVQRIRQKGFEVCLDDFGAGAASFQYLRALKVDWVKIDGLYVRRVLKDQRDKAMIESLVELCRKLGVRTVAEQIETVEEAAALRAIGVELGQGWLFGRPADLPAYKPPLELPTESSDRPNLRARRAGYRESWG
ncbi:MAG TPA: EAL domain-containing protein [Hypericibacter adhaerens]|uniref:EAL domain-containing protein n=1 Tax=Hypericibacter adhaerens TaxID=2602016 RepID=UPI00177F87AE|nr:EAL domain-containing protein [Hypericibacter adhaerens]HWA41906.1 EAL domain-containing protein [Hypericibacter adhaerens]